MENFAWVRQTRLLQCNQCHKQEKEKNMETCELCGDKCEYQIWCNGCARMVCSSCMAAQSEEEMEERGELCEACF